MEAENKTGKQDAAAMAEVARGRTNLYNLLTCVFGQLPDESLLGRIKSSDLQELLDTCSQMENPGLKSGIDYVKSYIAGMESKSSEALLNELSVDRTRLLRAPGDRNLKPPYEGLYQNDKYTGASVLQLKNFYREAGLLPDEAVTEPPDYLCVELDFMHQLCHRESEQWLSGANGTATLAIEERFLREHLGSWVGEFCAQAEKYASTDFYRGFLAILDAFIAIDMEYLQEINSGSLPRPAA